jgi:hypothetical protein
MSADYYIEANGKTQGPYSMAQLRSMWDQGLITSDTQYWTESMDDWYLVSTLLESTEDPLPPRAAASGADVNIPTVSVDLRSVDAAKLNALLSKFSAIFRFATTGNILAIRARSEEEKQRLKKLLRKNFRSITIDERTPEKMPPAMPPPLQFEVGNSTIYRNTPIVVVGNSNLVWQIVIAILIAIFILAILL